MNFRFLIKKKTNSMYQYYSPEKEKEHGVVGIKISLISNGFRYTYNKLVRDKIPENIDNEPGRKSQYRILNDNEYLIELNNKVLEEANEFIEENSIEELGDLMEVINAIMKLKGYKIEEVYKVMKAKADKGILKNGTGIDKYKKLGGDFMKIITLCGSLNFQKEMMIIAEKMALEGHCILTPVYSILKNMKKTEEQLIKLKEAHFRRIELSDAILVVNVNSYVGNSTNLEIEHAKKLDKEIIYYTDLIKNN